MKKFKFSLKLSPGFFRTLFVALAVVMFWRGTWGILDTYLFPGNPLLSNVLSVLLGIFLLYLPDKDIKELA